MLPGKANGIKVATVAHLESKIFPRHTDLPIHLRLPHYMPGSPIPSHLLVVESYRCVQHVANVKLVRPSASF